MSCFDSSLPLIVVMSLMSTTMMIIHTTADFQCPEVEFLNVKNDVIHTKVGGEAKITFSVRFYNCSTNDALLVKISEQISGIPETIILTVKCNIIYKRSTCFVSESSSSCSCPSGTGLATFVTRLNETGNITYIWSWRYAGLEEKQKTLTFIFSERYAYNITDTSSKDDTLKTIVVGSTSGGFAIIVVANIFIILVFYRKSVKKTFTLPSPPLERLDGCGARDEGRIGFGLNEQQVSRQYQKVADDILHQKCEMSLYNNLSSQPEEWCDPDTTHSMSQDRTDLTRQSLGPPYEQVYDALFLQTATSNNNVLNGATDQPLYINNR